MVTQVFGESGALAGMGGDASRIRILAMNKLNINRAEYCG